ncbi:MAG TPA: hypothetical protein VK789_24330 [Bryobacteraceae bacterium]|nr:hypothetical protein [Bryobacteraceae bacterium]
MSIPVVFIALNYRAYDGFFQDDELDNLKWAPSLPLREFLTGLLSPRFAVENFRPVGHLYFHLMGARFGLDFPPYMTPVFAIHLANAFLLWLLLRKLSVTPWCALAATAFFTLSAAAFDAYWKPMYVFDLLCTTLCLASILFYAYRRWVLSFIAFWLAYKSKELAVMLPAVLLAYEYWFGERRYRFLIPFLLVSLSFGIQGIVLNPNKDNEYTFRFTPDALRHTIPFYSRRFLLFPFSGLALLALLFIRDRRVWFGLAAMGLFLVPLVFLPGRLYEAYAYLPLACVAIALGAAASQVNPVWAWAALALWMPFNVRDIIRERRVKLALDDKVFALVDSMQTWVAKNPGVDTFVYDGAPAGFRDWGVTGAWNIVHRRTDLPALYLDSPGTRTSIAGKTVAWGSWDSNRPQLAIILRRIPKKD